MTSKQNTKPIAHVRFDENDQPIEHWLEDHLRKVAKLSAKHASVFGNEDWAEIAGRWHDLGKYSLDFQEYIRDQSGYERENAHVERPNMKGRVNHSSAGALYAFLQFKEKFNDDVFARIIAYSIAGHHAGLADWPSESGQSSLQHRMQDKNLLADALN
ncbi:MAG: CRISPR-associated endonuclease Cas3'', partial [Thiotrichaceae bacterium]